MTEPLDPSPGGWDVPFEANPSIVSMSLDGSVLAGEITVMAGLIECDKSVVASGVLPVIVFRFGVDPSTGRSIPSVLLALDDERLTTVPRLVEHAVAEARKRAVLVIPEKCPHCGEDPCDPDVCSNCKEWLW
jgi:hypothetical protein